FDLLRRSDRGVADSHRRGPAGRFRIWRSRSVTGQPMLGRRAPLPASPEEAALDTVPNSHPGTLYLVRFTCPEFTCLCPVTGQPAAGLWLPDPGVAPYRGRG